MLRGATALCLLCGLLLCMPLAEARSHRHVQDAVPAVAAAELPPEARDTLRLIRQGGPFRYPRDSVPFGNYEHRLPPCRACYREYTVPTPGVRGRGARRIVCGTASACYYSDDHYRTFRRIQE